MGVPLTLKNYSPAARIPPGRGECLCDCLFIGWLACALLFLFYLCCGLGGGNVDEVSCMIFRSVDLLKFCIIEFFNF